MLKELWQSIQENSKERIESPVFASFAVSWIFLNWQPISFVLFSGKTLEEKFRYANQSASWLYSLILPLGSTVFFAIALPIISRYIILLREHFISATKREKMLNLQSHMKDRIDLAKLETALELQKSQAEIEKQRLIQDYTLEAELRRNENIHQHENNQRNRDLDLEIKKSQHLAKMEQDKTMHNRMEEESKRNHELEIERIRQRHKP